MGPVPRRRSGSNDLRAMEAYRRIHSTLGERVVSPPDAPPRREPRARPARQGGARRGHAAPRPPVQLGSLGNPRFASSSRRPRPAGPVLTATAVIALLALMALAVGRLVVGSPSTPAHRAAASASRPPRVKVRAAGAGSASGAGSRAGAGSGARAGRTTGAGAGLTTTTTTPSVLSPRSSTTGGASYVVPTASFSVQVSTTGACWMEVGPTSNGPFSFVGTVPSGQQRVFPASSQLWIRLGRPGNVTVAVNGTPVQLTAAGSAPYNLTISAVGA